MWFASPNDVNAIVSPRGRRLLKSRLALCLGIAGAFSRLGIPDTKRDQGEAYANGILAPHLVANVSDFGWLQMILGFPFIVFGATSIQLGVYLDLHPEKIYLHAGTRQGTRALGLRAGVDSIDVKDVPAALRRLTAAEIEDCLSSLRTNYSKSWLLSDL